MLTSQEQKTLQFIRNYLAQHGYAPKLQMLAVKAYETNGFLESANVKKAAFIDKYIPRLTLNEKKRSDKTTDIATTIEKYFVYLKEHFSKTENEYGEPAVTKIGVKNEGQYATSFFRVVST